MKKTRQEKIAELITSYDIETQDELIARLREHHFDVTQATVSRDIREMHISKMTTGNGTYRYVLPPKKKDDAWGRFSSRLLHSIVNVDHAQNLVVVKSHAGLAGIEVANTEAAFLAAAKRSYYGIETDVRKTKDGYYVSGQYLKTTAP